MTQPKVSALFTVFNKSGYLTRTIESVRAQMADETELEYVFVDDVSTDNSLDVIRAIAGDAPNLQIIQNTENRGPAVRLNQAAQAANGEYLYFLDSDDLAARGVIPAMLELLKTESADLIYGKTEKRVLDRGEMPSAVSERTEYTVSDEPLRTILGGGFVRMTLMCRRELYLRAGGADERIFIQDESLPLRLGMHAKRLIDWQEKVVYRQPDPEGGTHLSSNRDQAQHDAFLAAANAIGDLPEELASAAGVLYARAVSQHWKMRKRYGALPLLSRDFWRYQWSRCNPAVDTVQLSNMRDDFLKLKNVRRMT